MYSKAEPHLGYKLIKEICEMKGSDYFVFTSNVDNMFKKSGFSQEKIYEMHGNIFHY